METGSIKYIRKFILFFNFKYFSISSNTALHIGIFSFTLLLALNFDWFLVKE